MYSQGFRFTRAFLPAAMLVGLVVGGCGSAPPELALDGGGEGVDGTVGAWADLGAPPDSAPVCGPGSYPCGPYGTLPGSLLENLQFLGYVDRDGDKTLDTRSQSSVDYGHTSMQQYHQGEKKLLWIIVSAVWCSVCKKENQELAQVYKNGELDPRVEIYQVMFEDEDHEPMTRDKLAAWIEAFGQPGFAYYAGTPLTFPNVLDPTFKMGRYFDKSATPLNMLIELSSMKILFAKTGYSLQTMGAAIKQALNQP